MREIERRLAKLEAGLAGDPARPDHGLDPEAYAVAHAELTRLLSTHATDWPDGLWDATQAIIAGWGRGT